MTVAVQMVIDGSKEKVWSVITDVKSAAHVINGIEKTEIISKPEAGWVGLRWRETRMYFGEPAAVEKWITEAKENEYFITRAEMDGFVFITTMRISEDRGTVTLTSSHETRSSGIVARIKSLPMIFFRGTLKKAIFQDLLDIKRAVER